MAAKNFPRTLRIAVASVSILLCFFAFGVGFDSLAGIFALQLGPGIAHLFAAFAYPMLVVVCILLLLTFIFGRFYCSILCPFGILQDFIGWITRKPAKQEANYKKTRYIIASFVFAALIGGWAIGFRLLEPFTNFGAIAATTFTPVYTAIYNYFFPNDMLIIRPITLLSLATGLIPLILITSLIIWKKRIFCTAICPVGTLLGLCSKNGLLKMKLSEKCVKCGQCVKVCPAGCITPANNTLDNERCLRCMNCYSACRFGAIEFKKPEAEEKKQLPVNTERRRLLAGGVTAAAVLGLGTGLAGKKQKPCTASVFPPGAGSEARFISKCTSCQLCVTNCRGNVLRPAGAAHGAVHLNFDNGMCEFNCNRCNEVCPTGALMKLSLEEKQRRRIGLAAFNPKLCIAVQERVDCGACAEHCPTGALRMKENEFGVRVPYLAPELCIGCGNCEFPCPVRPVKAIVVTPVPIQIEAADPEEYFKENPPDVEAPQANPDGEWLI